MQHMFVRDCREGLKYGTFGIFQLFTETASGLLLVPIVVVELMKLLNINHTRDEY